MATSRGQASHARPGWLVWLTFMACVAAGIGAAMFISGWLVDTYSIKVVGNVLFGVGAIIAVVAFLYNYL